MSNNVESHFVIVCVLTGKRFPYKDAESKQKALAAHDKHRAETISRRVALAGRELDGREIVEGLKIDRVDTRTQMQRAEDRAWRFTPVPAVKEPDTRDAYESYDRSGGAKSFKQFSEEMHAKYLARTQKPVPPTAQQEAAVEASVKAWELTAFDSQASQKDFEFANNLRAAATGDPAVFETMLKTFTDTQEAQAAAFRADIAAKQAILEQRLVRYAPPSDVSPETMVQADEPLDRSPKVIHRHYPPNYDGPVSAEERARSNAEYAQYMAERGEQ